MTFDPAGKDTRVIALVAATLAVGIPLDALGPSGSQTFVSLWTWGVLLWVVSQSTPLHRRELVACVVLATLGELFLMEVCGLYHYRLLNLPLFIPPGHALVFTAAIRISRQVPTWFPWSVFAASAVYIAYAASTGIDTQGLIWFAVLAGFMKWGTEQSLYGVAFMIALVVETYGTSLGGWRYHPVEPWFGLTTTNPPVFVGAIYCTLEVMVRRVGAEARLRTSAPYVRFVGQPGFQGCQRRSEREPQLQGRAAAQHVSEDVLADFGVGDVHDLQRQ